MPQITTPPMIPVIDYDLISKWRGICHETHGDICNNRYSEALASHIGFLLLVDVVEWSLVQLPASIPTPYIALSYVWGRAAMLKTTKANFQKLQQPGALRSINADITIPATIRDAIHLVEALGERYLWVDCLCVVQDAHPDELSTMLRAMAYIYASAELTIVAACGFDAHCGLKGVSDPAQNRAHFDVRVKDSYNAPGGYPQDSKWASRSWTFQESAFSRRLLVFEDELSWLCSRCDWPEDLCGASDANPKFPENLDSMALRPHLGVPMGMMSLIPKIPSLGRWGMLVENFAPRELTYENDIGTTFAGATEIMEMAFPGGTFHGIPRFFFDVAILWQPQVHVSRRLGEPSWSWTGWKGSVECLYPWSTFFAGLFRPSDDPSHWITVAPLKPVAQYHHFTRDGKVETSVTFNGFYDYQALRNTSIEQLPIGWTRYYHPDGDYFLSPLRPEFKYAFPLPTSPRVRFSAHALSHISPHPYLSCTAPRAKLFFGEEVACYTGNPMFAVLCDSYDRNVGIITLHEPPQSLMCVRGIVCELIALSKAETSQHGPTASLALQIGGRFASDNTYERHVYQAVCRDSNAFYNVMWITWVGDVTERQGIGMVRETAWDALQPGIITFKLG